ncbi:hypothetical protein [Cylindrospermum stagnale]|nr:hypothetical protein [Cylindrospermum stagnale]
MNINQQLMAIGYAALWGCFFWLTSPPFVQWIPQVFEVCLFGHICFLWGRKGAIDWLMLQYRDGNWKD